MNKKFLFPLVASLLVLSACGGQSTSSKQESSQQTSQQTSQKTSTPSSDPTSEISSESSEEQLYVQATVRSGDNILSENRFEETEKGSNIYVGTAVMTTWNSIEFNFDGLIFRHGETHLEGLFKDEPGADWTDNLYVDTAGDSRFFRSGTGEVTYKFTYNSLTDTLKAEIVNYNKLQDVAAGVFMEAQEDGTFTETRVLAQWGRFQLKYYDADGVATDITTENTDVSGDAYDVYGGESKYHVYYEDGIFCTELTNNGKYTIVYTPANGETKATLVISAGIARVDTTVTAGETVVNGTLDETEPGSGVYVGNATLNIWNNIEFGIGNSKIEYGKVNLEGLFADGAKWDDRLYVDPEAGMTKFFRCANGEYKYKFTYTEATNTLKAEEYKEGGEETIALSLNVISTTSDSETTVWEEGTIVHNADNAWAAKTSNGWRTYLVVDSEGRIAYYCYNPANGYGGPDGASYNRNSVYADYTTNPAIEILPGFGPWEPGGNAHNQWNLKAPEGGFAITGYGDEIAKVIGVVTGGEASSTTAEGEINKYYAAIDDVRVSVEGGKVNFRIANE